MNLADVLLERETGSGAVLRDGIVAAISPLTVIVPPSTVASPAAKLDSCNPVVGSFVQVLVQGANRLVIGVVGGGWQTYTPTVKYGATTISVTNDSRWCRINKLVCVEVAFAIGGGAAGTLTVTRPVAGRMSVLTSNFAKPLGTCSAADISTGALHHGVVRANLADGSDIVFDTTAAPAVPWSNTVPFTHAVPDEYYATFCYEPAT